MPFCAPFSLCFVAGKKDNNCMKIFTGYFIFPVVGMITTGIAKHLRSCGHTLSEWFGKTCKRILVKPQLTKTIKSKSQANPTHVGFICCHYSLSRAHYIRQSIYPATPGFG